MVNDQVLRETGRERMRLNKRQAKERQEKKK